MQSKTHWEHIYTAKSSTEVSWYQPHATLSLGLIQRIGIGPDAAIIDVGGGASTLTDDLVAHGYRNLSVLDLSGEALAVVRRRLGQKSGLVQWIEADVTSAPLPERFFDVWHDRAVLRHARISRQSRRRPTCQATCPNTKAIASTCRSMRVARVPRGRVRLLLRRRRRTLTLIGDSFRSGAKPRKAKSLLIADFLILLTR
jgi:SAM-dependent methyltransferase